MACPGIVSLLWLRGCLDPSDDDSVLCNSLVSGLEPGSLRVGLHEVEGLILVEIVEQVQPL